MRLVNELLDWSQLEAGAMALDSAPVALPDFLRHLVGLFRPATEARGVELGLEIATEIPQLVLTDPLRLRQILSNLISNAVKFTDRGSVRLTLTTERAEGRRWRLCFAVSDTGPGIAPEVQAKLFAPYVQADPAVARHFGGSGLGLARLLGGDIVLRSTPGEGSTFTLEIIATEPEA
jgi:signal transduction histidine kinase